MTLGGRAYLITLQVRTRSRTLRQASAGATGPQLDSLQRIVCSLRGTEDWLMVQVWAIAQGTLCPHEFACFHNGFIVASRPRLRLQPKKKYEYLLSLFSVTEGHPLRVNEALYHTEVKGVPEEWPTWGHVMERSWNALLNCTNRAVADNCGWPACAGADCTGNAHCQCLDPVVPDRLAPI